MRIAAQGFGCIHGDVGIAQQTVAILRIARKAADADTGADHNFLTGHAEGRTEALLDVFDNDGDGVRTERLLQHQNKFIAADTRHHIAFRHHIAEQGSNVAQQFIAGEMTQRVIDLLETIKIDIQHTQTALLACSKL